MIHYSLGLSDLKCIIRIGGANPWGYKVWSFPSLTLDSKIPTQSRKLPSHDEGEIILFLTNQNES